MDIPFRCRCGALRGLVTDASAQTGHRAVCYCDDCQTAAHALGAAAMLDARGGTEVFQVSQSQVRITEGAAQLRCMRLGPKGLMRWYAGCCDTPIANTVAAPRSPFVGVCSAALDTDALKTTRDAALGPVRMRVMGAFAVGGCPPDASPKIPLLQSGHLARLMLGWALRGRHRPSPFFDAQTNAPVVEPRVLSRDERDAARAKAGASPR
jgi:hypothetical protein